MSYRVFPTIYLCTVDNVKTERYSGGTETYDANDNATILNAIAEASGIIINQILHRLPICHLDTRSFDAPRSYTRWLDVDDDLLSITTFTNGDNTTIAASNYVLESANAYPKHRIHLVSSSTVGFTYTDDWQQAITITGQWGYVPHFGNHWLDTTVNIPTGGILSTDTQMTLDTASDATNFSIGDYICFNSVEGALVTGSDSTTGVITMKRGELGTTPVNHAAGISISKFDQLQDIKTQTARLASALYDERRGNFDGFAGANITDIAENVKAVLGRHVRYTI